MSSLEFIGYSGDYVKLRGVLSPARTGISPLEVPRAGTGSYSGMLHHRNKSWLCSTLTSFGQPGIEHVRGCSRGQWPNRRHSGVKEGSGDEDSNPLQALWKGCPKRVKVLL